MDASILVVDDDKAFRLLAETALAAEGFDVRAVGTLARARAEVDRAAPDVIILDRRLPDGDGIDMLASLKAQAELPQVIVVTAYGDVENAVEALRAGAVDYLTKPVQLTDLVIKLHKVLEARGLHDRLKMARAGAAELPAIAPSSARMREVGRILESVARSPLTPVLLIGPSGSGKQRAAEHLHAATFAGGDGDAPFVQVNCAALPDDLIENELFGHEKGAFTDARATQRGLIEMAAGGTLFLDEVTELPLRAQAKLLKFLDSFRVRRLGGEREMKVELRVVAATNADVAERVRGGQLREDLYHRLSVFSISVPALREHKEDIPALAEAFVRFFAARVKKRITGIAPAALTALAAYDYPGNVRELKNLIERAVILAPGPLLGEKDLLFPPSASAAAAASEAAFFALPLRPDGTPAPLDALERAYVARVLEHCAGHRTAAAQALGISYPTFLKRLRELGLE